MKRDDKGKRIDERESNYQKSTFMSDYYRNFDNYEKENFVVPWQLKQNKEEKILIK